MWRAATEGSLAGRKTDEERLKVANQSVKGHMAQSTIEVPRCECNILTLED